MKRLNFLSVAIAVAAFTGVASSSAQSVALSPRAQANQIRVVAGTSASDPNLVTNRPAGNAKAWALQQSLRTVAATGLGVDLAHAPRPNLSPKDPRFESALRENALRQVQVAPLK